MLYDHRAGGVHEAAQDVEGVVRVREVDLAGMLAELQELGVGGKVAAGLDVGDVAEEQVAVDQLVHGRLLAGILAVAEAFLLVVDHPGDLVVDERLAPDAVREADLEARRKVVVHDRAVGGFQVNRRHGGFSQATLRRTRDP